ncbi:hypothetical protein ACIBCS_11145 [Streptomyces phaeochromogenes]|uniref:hypothetical protein n=1 Tax=Streptomyces phaeochromogenes TaxID=1923 RepID=UPI0033CC0060
MDTTNATHAIRELVARSQEAQTDPEVLPALHTSDLVLINLAGRRVFGREAFESAMTAALASRSGTSGPRWRSTTSGSYGPTSPS